MVAWIKNVMVSGTVDEIESLIKRFDKCKKEIYNEDFNVAGIQDNKPDKLGRGTEVNRNGSA